MGVEGVEYFPSPHPMIRKIFSFVFDVEKQTYLLKVISVPNFTGGMGSSVEATVQLSRLAIVIVIVMLCIENGAEKGFSRLPKEF